MIAQMAATAGSVAIGSTIGHGISSMLFGGSSSAPVDSQAPPQQAYQAQQAGGLNCDAMAKGILPRCQISIHHLTHPVRLHKMS